MYISCSLFEAQLALKIAASIFGFAKLISRLSFVTGPFEKLFKNNNRLNNARKQLLTLRRHLITVFQSDC